jgi:hypothetical protein
MAEPKIQQVILALSERAANELAALIERGGYPADAVAGHPRVLDEIAAECRNQLARNAGQTMAEPKPEPDTATRVAQAMAKAAKKAVAVPPRG